MLARNLKDRGYHVFFDAWAIVPGKSLVRELYQGLQQSKKGILVVTSEAFESGWVREEYDQMMTRKHQDSEFTIIPIILGNDIPDIPFLRSVRWIDFRSQPYTRVLPVQAASLSCKSLI